MPRSSHRGSDKGAGFLLRFVAVTGSGFLEGLELDARDISGDGINVSGKKGFTPVRDVILLGAMKTTTDQDDIVLPVQLSGTLTLSRAILESLSPERRDTVRGVSSATTGNQSSPTAELKKERLAYTIQETAQLLGVSNVSVYRLVQRGLLKRSLALRRIIIPRLEIERFLRETTGIDR